MNILLASAMLVLIVVPKASVIALLLAAIAVLAASNRTDAFGMLKRPEMIGLLVFVGWSGCSTLITGQIEHEAGSLAKLAGLIIAGVLVLAGAGTKPFHELAAKIDGRAFAFSVALGTMLLAGAGGYAAVTGEAPWGSFYFDPLTTLNNGAVVLSLMVWPVLFIQWRQFSPVGGAVCAVAVVVISLLSSSAALGALFIGGCVIIARRLTGRRGGILFAVIIAAATLAAPYAVKHSGADVYSSPAAVNDSSSPIPYSIRHRLAMWSFATAKIEEKPLLGWGFNASRHIPQEDFRLAPNMEIMPLHPHNLALQTRLELGLPGAIVLAGLVFVVFYRLATFTDDGWKSGLVMAAGSSWFFIANVSYGMWQSWWIALAFLLALLMKIALAANSGESR